MGDTRSEDGTYVEAGEASSNRLTFTVDQVASAFVVAVERVQRAVEGEFGLGPSASIDSKMAQELGEVLLGDLPLDKREAALMRLGAFSPRFDATEGLGHNPPDEESDRQNAVTGVPDDDLPSERSSFDPATQSAG